MMLDGYLELLDNVKEKYGDGRCFGNWAIAIAQPWEANFDSSNAYLLLPLLSLMVMAVICLDWLWILDLLLAWIHCHFQHVRTKDVALVISVLFLLNALLN